MSGQPPFHVDPALASRLAAVKESVWLKIGTLQTTMNDRDSALDAFERVLRVNPANIYAMTQVGAVLAKKERYTQAVVYLQRAIAAESTCGEAWAVLAHCYVMTDDLPKAYQAYQNALNHLQDPSDPNLWYGIGLLYDRYGSLDNALEAFLAVLRIAPNFERAIEVCFCIGIIYKEQRKLDEAMNYFNKVSLAANPPPPLTRADGWYQIGHVNELKRDIAKALEMYSLALRENPGHAKTLQNLGWLEFSHKNNEREAIRLLQSSLEADRNDGQTWYLLGRVYMQIKEFRQAYDAYQQAVYRDGNNATFWCSIGVLYYSMNQYRDAMDAYARAIRLNPSVSEVWFDLGTLYESCGQTNDAIDAYRRAAELAPENDQITSRLRHLQSLTPGNPQHPAQQSQPMTAQPALQPPHPQLLPPQSHQPGPHPMQGQNTLPPPHQDPAMLQQRRTQDPQGQQPHSSQMPQDQRQLPSHAQGPLQLLGVQQGPSGSHPLQPPMQIVSQLPHPQQQGRQSQPQPHVQPLTRHINIHSLHAASGPGPHGPQDPMRPNPSLQPPPMHARNPLPQLASIPGQPNQSPQGSQVQGQHPDQGSGNDKDPRRPPHPGQQPGHSQGQGPQPMMPQGGPPPHGLPQLPSIQSQQDVNGARQGENAVGGQQVPHLPPQGQFGGRPLTDSLQQRRDVGGSQLEPIPSMPIANAQPHGYGPPSGSSSLPATGPSMAPIPPLAPLATPTMPNDGNRTGPGSGGQQAMLPGASSITNPRPPPATTGNENSSHQPASLKSPSASPITYTADSNGNRNNGPLPPVSVPNQGQTGSQEDPKPSQPESGRNASEDVVMGDSRAAGENGPSANNGAPLPPPDQIQGGTKSRNEDAELLRSVAGQAPRPPPSPPKMSEGGEAQGQTENGTVPASTPPALPGLSIPRSAPPSRPLSAGSSGGLGNSSLLRRGKTSSRPSPLPSPLPPLQGTGGQGSSGVVSPGLSNPSVPPLKSTSAPSSAVDALPSPSALPKLQPLSGKTAEGNAEESRGQDSDKKMTPVNGPASQDSKPRIGFRSVPLSSIAGGDSKESPSTRDAAMGSSNPSSATKREISPGSDTDKTHKRPRVQETTGNQTTEEVFDGSGDKFQRRRSQENGDSGGHNSSDVRMGEGNSNGDVRIDQQKRRGDGDNGEERTSTPHLTDTGRRSVTPRSSGPPPLTGALPSFRSHRGNIAANKSNNSYGSGEAPAKSPVLRSPALRLRSMPLKSQPFPASKNERPSNAGRPRDGSQARSSMESDDKSGGRSEGRNDGRNDGKSNSGVSPRSHENRRDSVGDKEHTSPDAKAEPTGTAS